MSSKKKYRSRSVDNISRNSRNMSGEQWPKLGTSKCQLRRSNQKVGEPAVRELYSSMLKSNEELLRNDIVNILNKLKLSNVGDSGRKIRLLPIDSEDKLFLLAKIIFETALINYKESEVYAKLCEELLTFKVLVNDNFAVFRKLLVKHCQQEFEKLFLFEKESCVPQKTSSVLELNFSSHSQENKSAMELKQLGTVVFLGNLFKCDMLTGNIMHTILKTLSKDIIGNWNCMCSLLLLIGKNMESKGQDILVGLYLLKMQQICSQVPISMQNQLKQIIKCRENKWQEIPELSCKEVKQEIPQLFSKGVKQKIPKFHFLEAESVNVGSSEVGDEWGFGNVNYIRLRRSSWKSHTRQARDRYNSS